MAGSSIQGLAIVVGVVEDPEIIIRLVGRAEGMTVGGGEKSNKNIPAARRKLDVPVESPRTIGGDTVDDLLRRGG